MRKASHRGVTIGAGAWKGRRLVYPEDVRVRPTMGRTRDSLFNSLGARVPGAVFADLFACGGAVGLEALSRGARHAHFVERDPDAVRALRANLAACGVDAGRGTVHEQSVDAVLAAVPCPIADATIVFADPPYHPDAGEDWLARLDPGALPSLEVLVVEHAARATPAVRPGLRVDRERRFGDTTLTYFVPVR